MIKAARMAQMAKDVAKLASVKSFCRYIDPHSTPEWGSFTDMGVFDPNGVRSYHFSDKALAWHAECLRG